VATQEIARKTALDQANVKLKSEELALKKEDKAASLQQQIQDLQAELQKVQLVQSHEDQRTLMNIQARARMNAEDNQTAKQLAALEIQTGEKIGYSTGTGINPNPSAR
jgi:Icc-related predicted phosphoesterase